MGNGSKKFDSARELNGLLLARKVPTTRGEEEEEPVDWGDDVVEVL